ncbi:MAG: Na+/H+ antiporter, partial [Thermoleophilaceae bacterium]
ATLVGQGLSFPAVIRALKVEDDGLDADEELNARLEIAFAAIDRIDKIAGEEWVYPGTPDRVRNLYEYRKRRFRSAVQGNDGDGVESEDYEARTGAYRRFMREVLAAERSTLRQLRDTGAITDEVRRTVEHDLDLEESRLDT